MFNTFVFYKSLMYNTFNSLDKLDFAMDLAHGENNEQKKSIFRFNKI